MEKPSLKEIISLKENLNNKLDQERSIWSIVFNHLEQKSQIVYIT